MMQRLQLNRFGQIREADITFGDLTVFVGEQASGKSILLQLIKLILDSRNITQTLKRHGFDWQKRKERFFSLYFGEGMAQIWNDSETQIAVDTRDVDLDTILARRTPRKTESLFLIPAHRVVTLKEGWPRAFTDYTIGDPYVVKQFSEQLRLLMEAGLGSGTAPIFPQTGRMNRTLRDPLSDTVFAGAAVKLDTSGLRKRIILDIDGNELPFMGWSSGQREFTPLLMGLYTLMPSGKIQKKKELEWVVIEEPEMGLHPKAISALLTVFLELMRRGYRVIVSTHSAQVLELVWALQHLIKAEADPLSLLKILNLKSNSFSRVLTKETLNKKFRTYYFARDGRYVDVRDISTLDAENPDEAVSEFGGLTTFSTKVSDIVTEAMWRAGS